MSNNLKFVEIVLKIAQKAELNRVLSLSDLAFHKFCVGVTFKHLIKNNAQPSDNTNSKVLYNDDLRPPVLVQIRIFFRLCYALLRSHFEYLFFALLFRMRNRTVNIIKKKDLKNFRYIFFSPPSDRNFRHIISGHEDFCLHAYLPFLNFQFLAKINKKRGDNEFVITPILPSISVTIKILKHLFTGAIYIQYWIDKILGVKQYCFFIQRTYFILIRQQQAKGIARNIKKKNPATVTILENDFSGIKLMLAEVFNNQKIRNVHIQHGTYFSDDVEFIPPISKYFFCCSERERNIQVKAGFDPKNLIVYGAPLQTLKDSQKPLKEFYSEFDIVVLASRGVSRKRMAGLLNHIFENFENIALKLRHDPAMDEESKLELENLVSNAIISKNRKLIEDIQSGGIIISFSEDAMISCLRQKKKTIFCPNLERAEKGVYGFLFNLPFLRVASSNASLVEAFQYLFKISDEQFEKSVDEKFIDYNFGISDINKVQNNIFKFLDLISKYQ